MKKIIITAVAFIFTFSVYAGSRPKTEAVVQNASEPSASQVKAPSSKPASKIKLTFVELGSVKCVPCKMMMPIMKEIEEKYGSEVKVVFHDVWTEAGRPYADKYGIRGIPTQVFLDANGKEFHRHTGFYPLEQIIPVLKQAGVNVDK